MGLFTGDDPPVDPATFMEVPYRERLRVLTRHWVDYGAGNPKYVMFIYIAKMIVFAVAGWTIATASAGLGVTDFGTSFGEPIVWQKSIAWILLIEVLGIGGAWGPLCGHFKPMTGGVRYWARPGTIRLPPWPRQVPLTAGNRRTPFDALLYVALLASLILLLALPGSGDAEVTAALGPNAGLLPTAALLAPIVLLVACGLRDKTIFLAARGEQWLPALIFFAFFPFVDMVVAGKLLIVMVWLGAGVSKLNRHFEQVIPPMVSNTPWNPVKTVKRMHYADFPDDLRPSRGAKMLTHVAGIVGELIPPLVLLFSHNTTVTLVAAIFMMAYHVFITSTFPLAVPLEWNLMFIYLTGFLFLGFPAGEGYGVGDMSPGLLALTVVGLGIWPVLGELRPDLVSFLPSLRQYSGNWATSMWALAPGVEEKIDERVEKPAPLQVRQLTEMFDRDTAIVNLHLYLAWRSLHSQGRGLNSVMMTQLGEDIDRYDIREGEMLANALVGWNFGDGHLHGPALVEAVQEQCRFEPGELIVVCAESEPIGDGRQRYVVIDAAVGIVERGSWAVGDAVEEQPWLPDGPIPLRIEDRRGGYERRRHLGSAGDGPVAVPAV